MEHVPPQSPKGLFDHHKKHNEASGVQNRHGQNDNLSNNCGFNGETDDPNVLALRRQRAKHAVAIVLLSRRVPMLLAGDEMRNSRQDNNYCYCQDNELSRFDWVLVE